MLRTVDETLVGPSSESYDEVMDDELSPPVQNTSLGELEAFVLSALWEKGQLSTPDVFDEVGVPRGLAYTTILTVLQRLHKKGLVTRKASGKSHVYSPALSREQFSERRGEVLAAAMVKLGSAGLSAFLSEADRLDPEFMAQLRTQLKELGS
jgi:predicted transcriptional regulator